MIEITAKASWQGKLPGAQEAAMRGLVMWAEAVITESNARVPHESGDLERTGTVTPDPGSTAVHVSYDGPYAVVQHENLEFRHEPGRTAKYLENAVNDLRAEGLAIVAKQIRGELS